MKILITGMSGFIATNFYHYLLIHHSTDDIYGFDLLYGQDIRNKQHVEAAIQDMDIVFNFAALTHIDSSIVDPEPFLSTNITGAYNILQACTKYKVPIIHISSSEVYGTLIPSPCFPKQSEYYPLAGHSPYAATKIAQDRMCYSWWQTYETNVRVIRLFNQYGPYQDSRKVIPKFIQQLYEGKPLTIYGDGKSKRDWVYVRDTIEGIYLAQHLPAGETVNICTGVNYTVLDLISLLKKITKKSAPILKVAHVDDRYGHVKELLGDPTKMKHILNWFPKIDFPTGLELTHRWFVENGPILQTGGDPHGLRYKANEGYKRE